MRAFQLFTISLLVIAGCSTTISFHRTGSQPADMVILHAGILTCDPDQPYARALAVSADTICYVGGLSGAMDFIGPYTFVVQGYNRRITPGFVDNHCHVLWIGGLLSLMPAEHYACESWEDLVAALLRRNGEAPHQPFVGGIGWKMEYVPGGVPRREILDEVIPDRPVILMSYSGQCGWLNTPAVEHCSEANPEAFEALGPVRDDETGECTGELLHFHAFNFLDFFPLETLDPGTEREFMDAMTEAIDHALSVGVTTMNDVQIYEDFIPLLLRFNDQYGLHNARFRCSYYVGHERVEDFEALASDLADWRELGDSVSDDHLDLGHSLKFYIDGTPDNRTSFMLEPFSDQPGNYGEPVWSLEDFQRVILLADSLGLQACTHACGDAGINRVLDAYEYVRMVNGPRDSRHRVEHCPLPSTEDITRMAELDILASMQPTHFFGDAMTDSALGTQRLDRHMPWRSMEEAGVSLSFGSDWCAGPINPVYGLLIAGTRMNYLGNTDWGPEESIDLENAISHWTLGSARALFMEDRIGSLEVGKFADFVVFNTDPLSVTSLWFLITHDLDLGEMDGYVDMTIVDGRLVYISNDAPL